LERKNFFHQSLKGGVSITESKRHRKLPQACPNEKNLFFLYLYFAKEVNLSITKIQRFLRSKVVNQKFPNKQSKRLPIHGIE